MSEPSAMRVLLEDKTKDELINLVLNLTSTEDRLRDRLFLLTGCRCFGEQDGMDGSCVECSYEHDGQFKRCYIFRLAMEEYEQRKGPDWTF